MAKGKIDTVIKIFNCDINVRFDAEILDDGSMILEFHDAIHIPANHFQIAIKQDMR